MDASDPVFPSTTTRIAVVADVHGNRRALEAILDDIASRGVEAVACNGDLITGSAHSQAVVDLVRKLGIPTTRGNHERYLSELANPDDEKWRQGNWAALRHDFAQLTTRERAWLAELPDTLCLSDGRAPVVMAHAVPGDDRARLTSRSTTDDWRAVFGPLPERTTLVGSHLHWFWQHVWGGYHFVRTPSAGLPLDGDHRAGYCLLERRGEVWSAEPCRVPYDLEAELDDLRASAYFRAGGVFTRLFWSELKTARWWVIPFLEHLEAVVPDATDRAPRLGYSRGEMETAWRSFDRAKHADYDPDGANAPPSSP